MTDTNPKVDRFLNRAEKWQQELERLREINLDCGLTEELKWGVPCYTYGERNVVLIHAFKEYCALLFFKGALLNDSRGILVQQTENVQSARQVRFTSVREIDELEPILKSYIYEAIEVEKAGLKVDFKKTSEFGVPEEFQKKLDKNRTLKKAFAALTPGRQRAYLLHFAEPKQSKTRISRIEKCVPRILDGKGLNDEYRHDSSLDAPRHSRKKSAKFSSVEAYLAAQEPAKEKTLRSIIDLVMTQFPELESKISWNVPTIHRKGKYVVGLAAFKNHLTFSAWSSRVIEDFKVRLGKFVVFKNCFQIPVDWKVDKKLVKDLVRARLAELD